MPRTSGEGALLRQPLLGQPLLGHPILGEPMLGKRRRRKSDRQWRLHNEPCFITHSFSAPPGRSLQTKSIYDSFPCRNRRSSPAQRPHYAVVAYVDAPLPRYANTLVNQSIARKSRSCPADAGTPLEFRL